jgi:hypothetical protein
MLYHKYNPIGQDLALHAQFGFEIMEMVLIDYNVASTHIGDFATKSLKERTVET